MAKVVNVISAFDALFLRFLMSAFSGNGRRVVCADIKFFGKAAGIPLGSFPFHIVMVKLLGLLVKRGDIFKNIVSAPGTYRTLHPEGIAADRALIVGVLLQNGNVK